MMNRDVVAGLALIAAGGIYAGYAWMTLPLGTVRQMGAGMFPAAVGILLAVFGLCILVPGLFRDEPLPEIRPRALVAVLASVICFALLVRTLGFVAAVVGTAALSSLALPGRRPSHVVLLCAALAVLTWVIFVLLLNLEVPVFRWSF